MQHVGGMWLWLTVQTEICAQVWWGWGVENVAHEINLRLIHMVGESQNWFRWHTGSHPEIAVGEHQLLRMVDLSLRSSAVRTVFGWPPPNSDSKKARSDGVSRARESMPWSGPSSTARLLPACHLNQIISGDIWIHPKTSRALSLTKLQTSTRQNMLLKTGWKKWFLRVLFGLQTKCWKDD